MIKVVGRIGCMIVVSACWAVAGEMPAFPGAEGFGSATPGGRAGRVLVVTNLDDHGPGSFRQACLTEGPRVIVFNVGGYITLEKDIHLTSPFCTIAGQTATGGGVCIRGGGLTITTHDVVVRHMRFRLGAIDPQKVHSFRDCVHMAGQTPPSRIVLDHCSFTWAVSRNLVTWSAAHDITVQWCLIAQPLRHPETDDHKYGGMGFLIGNHTKNISVHHCLFAHQYQRNPRLKHGVRADLINNVVYNWSDGAAMVMGDFARDPGAAAVQANVVCNWFQAGPDTLAETPVVRALTSARLYLAGNISNHRWFAEDQGLSLIDLADQPIPAAKITTLPTRQAYKAVLARAGAIRPRRDRADLRIVETVRAAGKGYASSEDEAGGWPDLVPGVPRTDTDSDGMPDDWERTRDLAPTDPSDASSDRDGDGYTNVEQWMNSLAPEPPATKRAGGS